MIDDIGNLLKGRLELWKKKNNLALPENLIVLSPTKSLFLISTNINT
jgi:hypothetical protein